jgi:entericidin B
MADLEPVLPRSELHAHVIPTILLRNYRYGTGASDMSLGPDRAHPLRNVRAAHAANSRSPHAFIKRLARAVGTRHPACGRRAGRPDFSNHIIEGVTDMKKLVAILMMLAFGGLAGCNTMQGLGKDVERGGEKMQNQSKDTQKNM